MGKTSHIFGVLVIIYRPFHLTRTIARARVGTRANRTAHATCRTRIRSSLCLLGLLAYEVKQTIAPT